MSSIAAIVIDAVSGNIKPSSFNHLSLANNTVSNIDSYNKKYPIHSEIIISTFSTGRTASSTLLFIMVILSSNLLFFTICLA